ncbi:MAG: hypothetical protein WCO06_07340 [Candidatus Roizmanbacteria bacterium]
MSLERTLANYSYFQDTDAQNPISDQRNKAFGNMLHRVHALAQQRVLPKAIYYKHGCVVHTEHTFHDPDFPSKAIQAYHSGMQMAKALIPADVLADVRKIICDHPDDIIQRGREKLWESPYVVVLPLDFRTRKSYLLELGYPPHTILANEWIKPTFAYMKATTDGYAPRSLYQLTR